MFTRTRSSIPAMFARLPPYSGISESTSDDLGAQLDEPPREVRADEAEPAGDQDALPASRPRRRLRREHRLAALPEAAAARPSLASSGSPRRATAPGCRARRAAPTRSTQRPAAALAHELVGHDAAAPAPAEPRTAGAILPAKPPCELAQARSVSDERLLLGLERARTSSEPVRASRGRAPRRAGAAARRPRPAAAARTSARARATRSISSVQRPGARAATSGSGTICEPPGGRSAGSGVACSPSTTSPHRRAPARATAGLAPPHGQSLAAEVLDQQVDLSRTPPARSGGSSSSSFSRAVVGRLGAGAAGPVAVDLLPVGAAHDPRQRPARAPSRGQHRRDQLEILRRHLARRRVDPLRQVVGLVQRAAGDALAWMEPLVADAPSPRAPRRVQQRVGW